MCRLSLTVNYPDSVIEKMLLHQHMGGPDYKNWVKVNDKINFGHNLLAIIGHTRQPLLFNHALSYVGEWYDYKEYYPSITSDTDALYIHLKEKGFRNALDDV